jgi:Fe2+ transport system protein FeoA
MTEALSIRLAMISSGETVRIVSIEGGQGIRKRLADLGLNLGEVISVIQTNHHGPMILAVKESRLAIGRGIAHKIMVESLQLIGE